MPDKPIVKRLAKNLKRLMAVNDLTQRKLARLAGEPVMNLNRILSEQCEPKVGTVKNFAKALNVTVDDLL